MKNPNKLVTIAKNMSKVYDAGRDAVISNTVKEVGSIRPQSHSLYPLTKQIADNVERIYEAGQASAEALKREASGAIVSVNDVNSVEHDVPVVLSSKNLLPYPYCHSGNGTTVISGLTFTDNGDGTITINGTSTTTSRYYLTDDGEKWPLTLKKGRKYAMRDITKQVGLWTNADGKNLNNDYPVQVDKDSHAKIRLYIGGGRTFDNVTVKPMVWELPSDATSVPSVEYVPPITDFSSVTVSQCGKNLFDYSGWVDSRHITVLDEASGEIKFTNVSGISAAAKKIAALPNTSYRISGYVKDTAANHQVHVGINYTDGSNQNITTTTTTDELGTYIRFEGVSRADKTLSYISFGGGGGLLSGTCFKEVQVELADEATAYEPHVKNNFTPNADGTVEGARSISPSMTVSTDTDGALINLTYYAAEAE